MSCLTKQHFIQLGQIISLGRGEVRLLKTFTKFTIVGLSGLVINMAVFLILLSIAYNYLAAAIIAFWAAVTNNFFWNMRYTFKDRARGKSAIWKYFWFLAISTANLGVSLLILHFLVESCKISHPAAQLVSVGATALLNYTFNYTITFRKTSELKRREDLKPCGIGYNPHL